MDEVERLSKELQLAQLELKRARIDSAGRVDPGNRLVEYVSRYILVPAIVVVVVHYLTLYKLGLHRVYIQLICIGIMLPVGYDLYVRRHRGLAAAVLVGLLVAVLVLLGGSAIVWMVDRDYLFPASARGWQLTLEFLLGLVLASASGNAFASATTGDTSNSSTVYSFLARMLASIGPRKQQFAADYPDLEKTLKATTAVITAIGALYTGIKSAIG
jgi:hypothetical protein